VIANDGAVKRAEELGLTGIPRHGQTAEETLGAITQWCQGQ
jgi:hypothetical protein